MKHRLRFYVQVSITVDVETDTQEELDKVTEDHQNALRNSISLDSNVDGKLRVEDVECADVEVL